MAELHNLQITRAHANTSQSAVIFTSRSLVTASKSRDSSASALTSLSSGSQLHWLCLLLSDSLTTD
jgi:hypothetical protein